MPKIDNNQNISKKYSKNNFWGSIESLKYAEISKNWLISDIPAYQFIYTLLEPKNKVVLDVGSFLGFSANNIIKLGAKRVHGIDDKEEYVKRSKKNYKNNSKLSFQLAKKSTPIKIIPNTEGYNEAVATFVHPTINSKEVLFDLFKRVNKVLLKNGRFFLLGLHPASFNKRNRYISYNHNLFPGTRYSDETAFPNSLKKNDGKVIRFNDYCWTEKTIHEILINSGFDETETLNLQIGKLNNQMNNILEKVVFNVGQIYPQLLNSDEYFKVPLFQVFIGKKYSHNKRGYSPKENQTVLSN